MIEFSVRNSYRQKSKNKPQKDIFIPFYKRFDIKESYNKNKDKKRKKIISVTYFPPKNIYKITLC
jgi:hypothetical protein